MKGYHKSITKIVIIYTKRYLLEKLNLVLIVKIVKIVVK